MDLVFSVNAATQDLRYGDPATGALATIQPLGFSCSRLVVMPDQRFVYVTGTKLVGKEQHAWFAAFDTCAGAVTKELDLGPGYGGQAAVPGAVGGTRAYVAISQASGTIASDTGPYGGSNRIVAVNIANPADPTLLPGAFLVEPAAGPNPYGTLHLVWSAQRARLYTTHRGANILFSIDPLAGTIREETPIPNQPTGLALSRSGFILYVGQRLSGTITALDIAGPQVAFGGTVSLPQGLSNSAIYLAVDAQDRIIATSAQRPHTVANPNPNPNPVPGQVFVVDLPSGSLTPRIVDVQGTWLGQPAPTPDGTRVFVPRGDQNDLVEIDPAPNPPAVIGAPIQVGHSPTDAVAVDHVAGQTLTATPAAVAGNCNVPQQVTIRAFDACGNERQGVAIVPVTGGGNPLVLPAQAVTPAVFDVHCTQHGSGAVSFATVAFPFTSIAVPVDCQCPVMHCLRFFNAQAAPIAPSHLAGVIPVTVLQPGIYQGPQIFGDILQLRHATLRFRMPPGKPASRLVVRYTRHDTMSQAELATVTHAAGITPVGNTAAGMRRGDFEIVAIFAGITEWTLTGGAETWIREICVEAAPDLVPPGP
ncbi:MAG: hypothetical protein R3F55_24440 [Alphaproteobacteria bacterium]